MECFDGVTPLPWEMVNCNNDCGIADHIDMNAHYAAWVAKSKLEDAYQALLAKEPIPCIQTAWEIESQRVEAAWHAEQARCEAGEQASAHYILTWNELADEYGFAHIMSKNEPETDHICDESLGCCDPF